MRNIRVRKIKQLVNHFVEQGVIDANQCKNAYRFFKRAWNQGKWKTQKKELDELLLDV